MKNILTEALFERIVKYSEIYKSLAPIFIALSVVIFIATAIVIFKISKRAKIKYAWFSFIPVVSDLALGRLAQRYVLKNGKRSAKLGIWLLISRSATYICTAALICFGFNSLVQIGGNLETALKNGTEFDTNLFASLVPVFILYMLCLLFGITRMVLYYISLYRTYAMLEPKKAVLLLILSVITVTVPIFLFVLSNNTLKATPEERKQNE